MIKAAPFELPPNPNPNSPYKLILCPSLPPKDISSTPGEKADYPTNDCTTDVFHIAAANVVLPKTLVTVDVTLSGAKFLDADGDGSKGSNEYNLPWNIEITSLDSFLVPEITYNTVSNSWSAVVDLEFLAEFPPSSVSYLVCEENQTGWTQTAPSPSTSILSFSVEVIVRPGGNNWHCYKVIIPLVDSKGAPINVTDNVTNLDFGNYPDTSLAGIKFYDSNGNGVQDGNESGIANWTIQVTSPSSSFYYSTLTGTDGTFEIGPHFPLLSIGTPYTLSEFITAPAPFSKLTPGVRYWVQTGPTNESESTVVKSPSSPANSISVTVASNAYAVTFNAPTPSSVTGLAFGNRCFALVGGLSPGYWQSSNPNGLRDLSNCNWTSAFDGVPLVSPASTSDNLHSFTFSGTCQDLVDQVTALTNYPPPGPPATKGKPDAPKDKSDAPKDHLLDAAKKLTKFLTVMTLNNARSYSDLTVTAPAPSTLTASFFGLAEPASPGDFTFQDYITMATKCLQGYLTPSDPGSITCSGDQMLDIASTFDGVFSQPFLQGQGDSACLAAIPAPQYLEV